MSAKIRWPCATHPRSRYSMRRCVHARDCWDPLQNNFTSLVRGPEDLPRVHLPLHKCASVLKYLHLLEVNFGNEVSNHA